MSCTGSLDKKTSDARLSKERKCGRGSLGDASPDQFLASPVDSTRNESVSEGHHSGAIPDQFLAPPGETFSSECVPLLPLLPVPSPCLAPPLPLSVLFPLPLLWLVYPHSSSVTIYILFLPPHSVSQCPHISRSGNGGHLVRHRKGLKSSDVQESDHPHE